MTRANFVKHMQQHQVLWAAANGLHPTATENGGTRDHVLLHDHQHGAVDAQCAAIICPVRT